MVKGEVVVIAIISLICYLPSAQSSVRFREDRADSKIQDKDCQNRVNFTLTCLPNGNEVFPIADANEILQIFYQDCVDNPCSL